ncbi:OLC1v1026883C1 [Oldenlandia corymbosa var. corymbosa]|uniref:OLC1v1026883C1 n=1 Tax=Oldenlandia corymbosa var. corymbosa TaxID=529605 RepID=A0AAV1CBD7_OLDCO|nr:OLC1v1026883C1 [Oldenlandia corymbosa var. corymbosa]
MNLRITPIYSLEHEPFILKFYNFLGAIFDSEPKAATLLKISKSEEFQAQTGKF